MVMVWSWFWATIEGVLYLYSRKHPGTRLLTGHVHDHTLLGWLTVAYAAALVVHLLVALGLIRFDGFVRSRTGAAIPPRSTGRLASGIARWSASR